MAAQASSIMWQGIRASRVAHIQEETQTSEEIAATITGKAASKSIMLLQVVVVV
jgi:hypothetical protein